MKDQTQVVSLDDLAIQMLPRKIITAIDLSFKPVETGIEEEEQDGWITLTISQSGAIDHWFSTLSPREMSDHEKEAGRLN